MGVLGWKNALVAEVGALVFISISKFFSPMWNGSIPIDFHPNDNLRLVVLLQKKPERCEGITKLVFFHQTWGFTSLHGPRFQLYQKKWGVFLLLKNFGDLVAQLGLKTTCFCGTYFSHIKLLEL